MIYTGTQINPTATYSFKASAKLDDVRGKLVTVSTTGVALATGATSPIMGIAIISNDAPIAAGDDVDVQIKEIGYVKAGGTITAGALLTSDSNGCAVAATSGYVIGQAMSDGVAGDYIPVQIVKMNIAEA